MEWIPSIRVIIWGLGTMPKSFANNAVLKNRNMENSIFLIIKLDSLLSIAVNLRGNVSKIDISRLIFYFIYSTVPQKAISVPQNPSTFPHVSKHLKRT